MNKPPKERVCFYATGTRNLLPLAIKFWRSMVKFHDPKEIEMWFFTDAIETKDLPEGIHIKDIAPFLTDPAFFYRQKPMLSEMLLEEFDLVVGFDIDQIVLASLNDVLNVKTYDVGVVINWNRFDEKFFPMVHQLPYTPPIEYYNCGLVALRSKKFAHMWNMWCHSSNFDRSQYKEQDGLNILAHHANFNVWCFDSPASQDAPIHWYGIISKGELVRCIIEDGKPVIPQGLGKTPFPPAKVYLHMIHSGGGHQGPKDNWETLCSPALMEYINEITK